MVNELDLGFGIGAVDGEEACGRTLGAQERGVELDRLLERRDRLRDLRRSRSWDGVNDFKDASGGSS